MREKRKKRKKEKKKKKGKKKKGKSIQESLCDCSELMFDPLSLSFSDPLSSSCPDYCQNNINFAMSRLYKLEQEYALNRALLYLFCCFNKINNMCFFIFFIFSHRMNSHLPHHQNYEVFYVK